MKRILLSICVIFSIGSAFAQNDQIYFYFNNKIQNMDLELGTEYELLDQRAIKVDRFDYYLSNISLLKGDDLTEDAIPESYLLMTDNSNLLNKQDYTFNGLDISDVRGIRVHIGIDPVKNHADPALNPISHPLALQSPSMHWGWSGGYRFLVIKGSVDKELDGNVNDTYAYEAVSDDFYESFDILFEVPQNGTISINLDVHIDKLLENMNFSVLTEHGAGTMVNAIMDNAATNDVFVLNQSLLSIDEVNASSMEIFPNPANATLFVTNSFGIRSIGLVNQLGQKVLMQEYMEGMDKVSLDLNDIKPGAYHVFCTDVNGKKTNKLVVIQ